MIQVLIFVREIAQKVKSEIFQFNQEFVEVNNDLQQKKSELDDLNLVKNNIIQLEQGIILFVT